METRGVGGIYRPPEYQGAAAVGRFTVDPDQARQSIADLRELVRQLNDALDFANDLTAVPAPGGDEVSVDVAQVVGRRASDEEVGVIAALRQGRDELAKVADKLEADLKTYLDTEQVNIPEPSQAVLSPSGLT